MMVRLSKWQRDTVRLLAREGMFGTTSSEVIAHLVQRGIMDLVTTEYVRKHRDFMRMLKHNDR